MAVKALAARFGWEMAFSSAPPAVPARMVSDSSGLSPSTSPNTSVPEALLFPVAMVGTFLSPIEGSLDANMRVGASLIPWISNTTTWRAPSCVPSVAAIVSFSYFLSLAPSAV